MVVCYTVYNTQTRPSFGLVYRWRYRMLDSFYELCRVATEGKYPDQPSDSIWLVPGTFEL